MHPFSLTSRRISLLCWLMMITASISSAFHAKPTRFLQRLSLRQSSPPSPLSPVFSPSYSANASQSRDRSTRVFSDKSSGVETSSKIDPKHLKSYHIQGQSTSPTAPASSSDSKRSTIRRRRGSGPGVTLHTVNTKHTLQTDVPKAMGGTNLAPQPVETLLAALIGCTQATALFVGRQLGVVIDKMEFDVVAARDERGALQLPIEKTPEVPSRLQEITGTVKVYTPELLSKETMDLLQEQTETRCPVANMVLASGCQMNVEWISVASEIDNI